MPLSNPALRRVAAAYGATAVAMGAFGAHGLAARQPAIEPRLIKSWETASAYLLAHAVALLALSSDGVLGRGKYTAEILAAGAAMFSGSIYGLVLLQGPGGLRKLLGPMTPLGGSLMIVGWASMLF